MNEYLSAYTGPTPETGYVGYINLTRVDGVVHITMRPESPDGSGTVELVIPEDAAKNLCMEVAAKLMWGLSENSPTSQSDGPAETIDGFETGNTVAPNASQSDEALVEAINDYNSILRSCSQVAKRKGEDTNWDALGKRITRTLEKHHATWLKHWNGKIS